MSFRVIGAAAALCMLGVTAASAATLDDVKARGVLRCGVAPNSPGFAFKDAQGNYRGFDVDFCHAIAAAVLGDGKKIELSPLGLRDGFATLASGGVDVLTHRFTWTFNRDNGTGIQTVTTVFYDGQGFIVRKSANLKTVKDLNGATICVAQGSTSELNLADYFRARGMKYQTATFADLDEARNAYEAGRCDAWTNDRSNLAARSQGLKNRADHMLLAETISKEPIGPMVKNGDDVWFHIVRWTVAAVIAAEELGVTSQNVDQLRAVRRSPWMLFVISTSVVVGMWLERYMILVTSLYRDFLVSSWGEYHATFWDWAIFAGTIGLFLVPFLLLIRLLPVISIFEEKEVLHEEHKELARG